MTLGIAATLSGDEHANIGQAAANLAMADLWQAQFIGSSQAAQS